MAKHLVEVVEDFEVRTQLGALVLKDMAGATVKTVAPPEEHVSKYKAGEVHEFNDKPSALKYCKHHGAKVRYKGPKPPKKARA